jgi:hypothetical protein
MNLKSAVIRLASVFITSAVPVIGVGSILGVSPLISAAQAGALSVLRVVSALAVAYKKDGKLDATEYEAAFDAADQQ